MQEMEPAERAWRARADLVVSVVIVLLGIAVTYASWIMPRLEERRIHVASVPGLVPFLLGVALTLCGLLLLIRSLRMDAPGGWRALFALIPTLAGARVAAVIVLALTFTLGLVGWLPFWAAAMIFVFAFIIIFETWLTTAPVPLLRSVVWAAVIAAGTGIGVYIVFERIFLVRLP
jgi:hypothetical protein